MGNTEDESGYFHCDIETSDSEKRHLLLYRSVPEELQHCVDQILVEYVQLMDKLAASSPEDSDV